MKRWTLGLVLGVLAVCTIGSCGKDAPRADGEGQSTSAMAVQKHFGTRPVTLTVELSSDSITTADALTCRLTLQVDEGYEADFPDLLLPDDMPGVVVTGYSEGQPGGQGATRRTREYEIEPEYAGTLTFPALQVYYHATDEDAEHVIDTEPIEITVAEVDASDEALTLTPVRGLITVETIAAEHRRIWPWFAGGVVAVTLVVAVLVYWLRRPKPVPPPPPAHEVALARLRALVDKDLIAQGQVEPFFVEITSIIRDYIEQAFGVRAPEQTTQEFLARSASAPAVARHRGVLEPFLVAADEVKFARAVPDQVLIQRTFDTARDFVMATSNGSGGAK
ncbi:MAG: BatD family protein [Phycisphaerae bacterium]|nr:BatD family protein [Phycisphaerae bacterium]